MPCFSLRDDFIFIQYLEFALRVILARLVFWSPMAQITLSPLNPAVFQAGLFR